MKALLSSSSYFNSSPTTATNDGNSSNNRKNDLFHHINNNNINNDSNNGVGSVEAEFSRQQQMNEMLYGSKERYVSQRQGRVVAFTSSPISQCQSIF